MTDWKALLVRPGAVRLSLVLVTILLLLAGCGGTPEAAPTDLQTSPPATQPVQATAEPGAQEGESMQSPLPTPQVELPWDAAPAEGKAIVRGQIEITQEGVLLGELFLARAVPTTKPDVNLLEVDQDNSPRALLDRSTGQFIFVDVDPGTYGLIVWEPMSSGPVADPDTGETLFFDVSADEVKDLGTVYFP